MSFLDTMLSYFHAWFGYVSWCLSASDLACRPFLAFFAMLGASGGTLVLACLALSTLLNDLAWELAERRRARRAIRDTVAVAEKTCARAALPHATPDERVEPAFVPGVLAISMAEPAWPEAGPPLPPAL